MSEVKKFKCYINTSQHFKMIECENISIEEITRQLQSIRDSVIRNVRHINRSKSQNRESALLECDKDCIIVLKTNSIKAGHIASCLKLIINHVNKEGVGVT